MKNSNNGVIIFILLLIIGYLIFDKLQTEKVLEELRNQRAQVGETFRVSTEDLKIEQSPEEKAQNLECEKLGEDLFGEMVAKNSNYFDSSHKTALHNGICYVAIGSSGGLEIKVNEFDIHPYEVIYNVKTGEIFRLMGTTLVRTQEGGLKPVCLATLNGTQKGLYKCLDLEVRETKDIEKNIF
jgi:hypothetical protein